MFAVQCSFCQHENTPGARFCTECGSPLHLKVCPNEQCGKVSDVNAIRCEHCGTPFPKIALVEPGTTGEAQRSISQSQPASTTGLETKADKKSGMSAWPLIVVAIVAGGLPLLWINRAALPTPKTWQATAEAERPAERSAAASPAQTSVASTTPAPTAPAPAPAPPALTAPSSASGAETLTLPPLSASIPPAQTERTEPAEPARQAAVASADKPAASGKIKEKRDTNAKKAKPAAVAEAPEPARPCTEAAAALGLCDPRQVKQ